jgi:hypothetical protein
MVAVGIFLPSIVFNEAIPLESGMTLSVRVSYLDSVYLVSSIVFYPYSHSIKRVTFANPQLDCMHKPRSGVCLSDEGIPCKVGSFDVTFDVELVHLCCQSLSIVKLLWICPIQCCWSIPFFYRIRAHSCCVVVLKLKAEITYINTRIVSVIPI